MIRIALAQMNPTVGDLKGNSKRILDFIHKAREQSVDVIVFPELVLCGYPPEDLLLKKHFIKDTQKILLDIASQVRDITAIIGFCDRDKKGQLYNAAAILEKGRLRGVYHKQELPNYGVFDERRYFHPGKKNVLYSLCGVKAGITICEDIWTEPSVCSRQAREGAAILINLSSSPYDWGKLKLREDLLKNRAKRARKFVCYVNLVGGQDELVFDGSSMIVNPSGKIVACGKQFEEDFVVYDLPVGNKQSTQFKPAISSHVSPKFTKNERVYRALVLGTRDYMLKNGFQKAVLGLSGGIDSALVACIAVDAVGKENVIGVSMPSRYSSEETKMDARKIAKNLGIEFREIPIQGVFEAYLDLLKEQFKNTKVNIAEENIQARIRGNILMALSNKFGWLVLTTGNKSEMAVGYCTLYGDMSGGFAVIKDVPKSMVYRLAKSVNTPMAHVPKKVLERAPSAELRENQRDQDSLPAYEELDQILKEYVEEHRSLSKIASGKKTKVAQKVISLIEKNEYKRRQSPPGVKITQRAFGKDWRLPITNKYKEN